MLTCQDVFKVMERIAPASLAEAWDNSGLQVGDPQAEVKNILLALDFDRSVLQEAVEQDCQLIITHHPFLFRGVKKIDFAAHEGSLIRDLAKWDISLFSAHTNLDSVEEGVNDQLARLLGLEQVELLNGASAEKLFKLTVFVPEDYLEAVQKSLWQAGAGQIGEYEQCSFAGSGTGTFLPQEQAQPFIGQIGELTRVPEFRLEVIFPQRRLKAVLTALRQAHPYEEPAFEYFPIQPSSRQAGLGRLGNLPQPMQLSQLLSYLQANLNLPHLRYGGREEGLISRVALCGGSGSDFWLEALAKGAEVLITGDVKYHEARNMLENKLSFVDVGHYASEIIVLPFLKQALSKTLPELNFYLSQVNGEPFKFK